MHRKLLRVGQMLLLAALLIVMVAACRRDIGRVEKPVPGGDVEQGRVAIVHYGCAACHTIPGVADAVAVVGPPLLDYESRHYIAGSLPNTVDNLIYWLQFPQSVEPGTAMPNLNVTETDARNMVAYLFSQ